MSEYVHSFDDEEHDRFFEVRIKYDFEPGYWDREIAGYWVPADINVYDVFVLQVEYYDSKGNHVARVKREDTGLEPRIILDGEAFQMVEAEVEAQGLLVDELTENAG